MYNYYISEKKIFEKKQKEKTKEKEKLIEEKRKSKSLIL